MLEPEARDAEFWTKLLFVIVNVRLLPKIAPPPTLLTPAVSVNALLVKELESMVPPAPSQSAPPPLVVPPAAVASLPVKELPEIVSGAASAKMAPPPGAGA